MLRARLIPCLLYLNKGLYKTVKFKKPGYIGDPINAIKIFNDKEVDELIFLDITASVENRPPDFQIIKNIASECFMPLCYGGGISTTEQAKKILEIGVEKISFNTSAIQNPSLINETAKIYGNQSIVVSFDVKKNFWGKYEIYQNRGTKGTGLSPVEFARNMENEGAGELLVTSIEREGSWEGFDCDLIHQITQAVSIPVIAGGGAGSMNHIQEVVQKSKASAVALGSMVVYQKKGLGVLINFPERKIIETYLS